VILGSGGVSVRDVASSRRFAITEIQKHVDRDHAQPIAFAAVYDPNQFRDSNGAVLPSTRLAYGTANFSSAVDEASGGLTLTAGGGKSLRSLDVSQQIPRLP
jgi:hypothetical protein